jgi:hemerythrin-like domain-containing protein
MGHVTKTAREHAHILIAVHTLEKALTAAAPGREVTWKKRAGAALVVVGDELEQHVESAEGDDGLIATLEAKVGHMHEVSVALRAHKNLLKKAHALLDDLATRAEDEDLRYEDVRSRALDLTEGLRHHQALENDLIFLAFGQDVGAAD